MSKFHNTKMVTPDGSFDSKHEFNIWCDLKKLQETDQIFGLERQVRFELVPQTILYGTNGRKKKTIRSIDYVADFVFIDRVTGELHVWDAKGFVTETFRIKAKLFAARYGYEIEIV